MKKVHALLLSISMQSLYTMDPQQNTMDSSNSTQNIVEISDLSAEQQEKIKEYIQQWRSNNYYFDEDQEIINHYARLTPELAGCLDQLARKIPDENYAFALVKQLRTHVMTTRTDNNSPATSFIEVINLLGFDEGQPEGYYYLPRKLRAFYTRFLTWPKLFQDEAILRGIDKHQIPGLIRPEFKKRISQEEYTQLKILFSIQGFDIEKPAHSKRLTYKTFAEIQQAKALLTQASARN